MGLKLPVPYRNFTYYHNKRGKPYLWFASLSPEVKMDIHSWIKAAALQLKFSYQLA
jgi:hypothetical protein